MLPIGAGGRVVVLGVVVDVDTVVGFAEFVWDDPHPVTSTAAAAPITDSLRRLMTIPLGDPVDRVALFVYSSSMKPRDLLGQG